MSYKHSKYVWRKKSVIKPLPKDAMFQVLLHSNMNTIMSLCQTDKTINTICKDQYFWQQKILIDYPNLAPLPQKPDYQKLYQVAHKVQKLMILVKQELQGYEAYVSIDFKYNVDLSTILSSDDINTINKTEPDEYMEYYYSTIEPPFTHQNLEFIMYKDQIEVYYRIYDTDFGHHADHTELLSVQLQTLTWSAFEKLLSLILYYYPNSDIVDDANDSYFNKQPPWWGNNYSKKHKQKINRRFVYWTGKQYYSDIDDDVSYDTSSSISDDDDDVSYDTSSSSSSS
ncbi:MAG TPA: hypothetical protein VLG50_07465 [Candidatus Saccharimonadales bacterium]|nr:hypothetical protein [Candidatus Saccharimonadales bacterium]